MEGLDQATGIGVVAPVYLYLGLLCWSSWGRSRVVVWRDMACLIGFFCSWCLVWFGVALLEGWIFGFAF
jgi:hypothetical protein